MPHVGYILLGPYMQPVAKGQHFVIKVPGLPRLLEAFYKGAIAPILEVFSAIPKNTNYTRVYW